VTQASASGNPTSQPTSSYRVPLARFAATVPSTEIRPFSSGWATAGIALLAIAFGIFALGEWSWAAGTGAGLVVAPICLALTFFVLRRPISDERSFDLGGLLLASLAFRLLASYPRFLSATDAHVYDSDGAVFADDFRKLVFTNIDVGNAPVPGTGVLRIIAGLVHVLTDSNFFGSTLVFGFLAFWGCWFFYRAFVTAIPDGDHRRYARFIFLWPSLLYWPTSIGKESWMVFTAGMVALGAARLLNRSRGGYVLIGSGMLLCALVRPHVALLLVVALAVAFFVGRRHDDRPQGQFSLAGLSKVIGIVMLIVAGSLLAPATASFLHVDDLSTNSITNAIENTQARTDQGNSAFSAVNPNSPLGYPAAVITVLFRPLPGEVSGISGLLSGLEGLALLAFVATSWRRIWTALRRLRSQPYLTFAVSFVAMFTYAFAALSNFGILSRERVQVLPFLFVLLALPLAFRRTEQALGAIRSPN